VRGGYLGVNAGHIYWRYYVQNMLKILLLKVPGSEAIQVQHRTGPKRYLMFMSKLVLSNICTGCVEAATPCDLPSE
jgi:hypothetical protein